MIYLRVPALGRHVPLFIVDPVGLVVSPAGNCLIPGAKYPQAAGTLIRKLKSISCEIDFVETHYYRCTPSLAVFDVTYQVQCTR